MITLLSDWKLRDPYLGIFKGQLMNLLPQTQIVDITHSIELFNHSQTAFIAKNSYPFFPKKTVHILLSGLTFSNEMKPVLLYSNDHFFLGEDTGVFSMMFQNDRFDAYQYQGDMSLNATEKLALMAKWVQQNEYIENTIKYPNLKFQISHLSEPEFNPELKILTGKVAYIDSCCNAVTNIPIEMFEAAKSNSFTAIVSNNRNLSIKRHHSFYNEKESEVFLVNNRLGFIEITLYKGNIAAIADIKVGNSIEIQFH